MVHIKLYSIFTMVVLVAVTSSMARNAFQGQMLGTEYIAYKISQPFCLCLQPNLFADGLFCSHDFIMTLMR